MYIYTCMYFSHVQIQLCQKWLQSRQLRVQEATSRAACAFYLCRILVLCIRTLRSCPEQALAVPLRMLEVFLSPQSYGTQDSTASERLLDRLVETLVTNGELLAPSNTHMCICMYSMSQNNGNTSNLPYSNPNLHLHSHLNYM